MPNIKKNVLIIEKYYLNYKLKKKQKLEIIENIKNDINSIKKLIT